MSEALLSRSFPAPGRARGGCERAAGERLAIKAALALASSLLLAFIEPFGFAIDDFAARLGFWTLMIISWFVVFNLVVFNLVGLGVRAAGPPTLSRSQHHLFQWFLALVPIMTLSAWVAEGAVGWATTGDFIRHGLKVLVVTLGFELTCHLIQGSLLGLPPRQAEDVRIAEGGMATDAVPAPAGASAHGDVRLVGGDQDLTVPAEHLSSCQPAKAPRTPALAGRLPFGQRGEIVCLRMEDHYVRIHTARGSTLVLMRFTDALAELDGAIGLRVHRSWWVAASAVASVQRSARSTQITLVNGLVAPVSQPYVQAVKDLLDPGTSRAPAPTPSAHAPGGIAPSPWVAAHPGDALRAPASATRLEGFHAFGAWPAPTYAPHLELRRSPGALAASRTLGVDA